MNVQTSSWKFMRPPELLYYDMNSQDRRPGRTHLPAGSLHGEVSAFCIRLAISREAPTRKQCTYFTRGLWNCSRTDWACRATGYASTSKHLSQCTKTSELRDDLKGSRGSIGGFSNLVDECRRSVAQESRTLADVPDSFGFEPHKPCAGCVGFNRVIRKHNLTQRPRRAVERSVSFHCHDAVRNNEVDRNGGAQIEDAFLNALPVEDVLRPSISRTRHYAKHVLHAERDAGPVVGLDLWHGNKEIRFQHCPREPEIPHARIARP